MLAIHAAARENADKMAFKPFSPAFDGWKVAPNDTTTRTRWLPFINHQ
ncbi:hypothetical protein [Gaoshiqia sediminis]|nr:hypothetical protein [Gaoshiqia sediminis]